MPKLGKKSEILEGRGTAALGPVVKITPNSGLLVALIRFSAKFGFGTV